MADWTIIKILSWTESYFKKISQGHSREHSKNYSSSNRLSDNGSSSKIILADAESSKTIPAKTTPGALIPKKVSPQKIAIDSPRLTAEILLAYTLGIKRLDLYLQHDRPLEKQELSDYKACIKRRVAGEPVAYITGSKGFYESDFCVGSGVLIPRPDTETLVENALDLLGDNNTFKRVLELGVGSGAIVISLAKAAPENKYFANDISLAAIDVAQKNSRKIVDNQILFFAGTWFSSLNIKASFDLIVSNPPYISTHDIDDLQPEIKNFEPLSALDGGPDGLDCYRMILEEAHKFLVPGGVLMLEIGFDQKQGIDVLLQDYSQYKTTRFIKDLAGHTRVVKIEKID